MTNSILLVMQRKRKNNIMYKLGDQVGWYPPSGYFCSQTSDAKNVANV